MTDRPIQPLPARRAGPEEASDGLPASWTRDLVTSLAGRRVVLVGGPLGSLVATAEAVAELDAIGVHLVGTGAAPFGWEDRCSALTRPEGGEQVLAASTLRALPEAVLVDLDTFDPDRSGLVIGSNFYEHDVLAGRRYVGARRPEWRALENKTTVDALWDAVGVRRARSLVVPTEGDALADAARQLDTGRGTVWSGDIAGMPSASGELVRWVSNPTQADRAAALLRASCPTARVAPFLDGVPCSIHALVTDTAAAVFRPVEIVMLRQPDGGFLYAGTNTWWDPPSETRHEMRDLARRVAAHLSATVGYRGTFGIDGICGPDGFVPTEINTRWGAGLYPVVGPTGIQEMLLLERFITDGLDGAIEDLESEVTEAADGRRWGGPTLNGRSTERTGRLLLSADGAEAPAGADAVAWLVVHGETTKTEVMVRPSGPTHWLGRSMATIGAAGFRLADQALGTDIGAVSSWEEE